MPAVATGVGLLTQAGIKSAKCRFQKRQHESRLRQNIETELMRFQDKANPMAEKMRNLHEHTEKILRDFKTLEEQVSNLSGHIEDIAGLTAKVSESMQLIANIAEMYGGFWLVLDMLFFSENTRAVNDMDNLAKKPIDEEIDESEMKSRAGKFIVNTRALIQELQKITDKLKETKNQLARFSD